MLTDQEVSKSETDRDTELREQSEHMESTRAVSEREPQPIQSSSDDIKEKFSVDRQPEDRVRSPTSPAEPSRYRLQLSTFSRYNSNFFQAGSDEPKKEAFLTTLAGKFAVDFLRREASTLTAEFQVARTFVSGVDDADWYRFDATLDYKFGRNDVALTYFHIPEGLALDPISEGDLSNGKNGIDLRFSRHLTRRILTRVSYGFTREDLFESTEGDSDRHEFKGDVRYRIHNLFIPRIGFELAWLRDRSTESSYNQAALVVRLESRIKNIALVNLRYRYRMRDYITDDPSFSNFGREDQRHDVQLLAYIKVTNHWWPFVFASYKHNDSSRANRSYTVNEVGIGMLFRFQ